MDKGTGVHEDPDARERTHDHVNRSKQSHRCSTVRRGLEVVARLTHTGTHLGAFLDLPPTGKHISTSSIHIFRFADGQLVEHWASRDDLGLMQQLGVLPMLAQTRLPMLDPDGQER